MQYTSSPSTDDDSLSDFYNDILRGKTTPSADYQKKYLLQLINTKIARVENKARYTKSLNYLLNILVMVLSATTTIVLGLNTGSDEQTAITIKNTALIISASMTFISGLVVFWDIENYWIRNKIMLNKLRELKYEYTFYLCGNTEVQPADLKNFLSRFLSSLGDEYWERFLKDIRQNEDRNDPVS